MAEKLDDSPPGVDESGERPVAGAAESMLKVAKGLLARLRGDHEPAVPFAKVYRDELLQQKILADDGKTRPDDDDHEQNLKAAWKAGLFGLAFSGGGIRSATFNLGVIQALSELKLLRKVHYLSVVSGGGYIGGWLTALLHRRDNPDVYPTRTEQFAQWEKQLSADGGSEDPAITHLRNYSNFLTPKKGLLTADTWSAVATYLRNALLNQVILVAVILAILIFGWLIAYGVSWWASGAESQWPGALAVSVIASLVGAISIGYNLASIADKEPGTPNGWPDGGVFAGVILPGIIGSIAACVWLPHLANTESVAALGILPEWLVARPRWAFFMILAAIFNLLVWAVAFFCAALTRWHKKRLTRMWLHTLFFAVVAAGLLGALLWLFGLGLDEANSFTVIIVIPPLMLFWLFLVATLHIGLVGTGMGTYYREWLSRAGAWLLLSAVAWLSLASLTLLGPFAIEWAGSVTQSALLSGWVATTLGALLASRQNEGAAPGVARRILFAIAPWVFIIGLVALISVGAKWIVLGDGQPRPEVSATSSIQKIAGTIGAQVGQPGFELEVRHAEQGPGGFKDSWYGYLRGTERTWQADLEDRISEIITVLLCLMAGVPLLSFRADVNEFSLRNMYANRLVRCYLGASVEDTRYGQPFTGFSVYDDLELGMVDRSGTQEEARQKLARERARYESTTGADFTADDPAPYLTRDYRGPYLLINTAVNLSKTSMLAWQERQAASFLLSPGYCGFETSLGAGEQWEDQAQGQTQGVPGQEGNGAYRPTLSFASEPTPISLGDAMATSGAAANPAMGYHSKTAYSVLLALFNVRLGRWVGNPRDTAKWKKSGPMSALWYLIKEALNSTSDDDKYLQLSDGGHFDNLGLYALVKRRCRYIICCDAGADGEYRFDDLGNAIRKCRIDLGVDIQIDVSSLGPRKDTGHCDVPCAVGRIFYRNENRVGTLVYIKPSMTVDIPSDVVNYALVHAAFPHETTADQFFSESQFESYRALGRHLALKALGITGVEPVSRLFNKLHQRWHPTPESVAEHFTKHAAALDELFDRLRKDKNLSPLDKQFYPGWRAVFSEPPAHKSEAFAVPLADPDVFRACFYFCNSLIQLMEDVFIDMNLRDEYQHPDNRGWINLFMHWSWSGMFKVAWSLSAATYGARFQGFCDEVLGLKLGTLQLDSVNAADWVATRTYHACESLKGPTLPDQPGSSGQARFNFLEWDQLTKMLGDEFDASKTVYQLVLVLDIGAQGGAMIRLPVGYAVIEGQKGVGSHMAAADSSRLTMYRVQDHLRKMGLGRKGLRELIRHDPTLVPDDETRLADSLVATGEVLSRDKAIETVRRFDEMFDSVSHEYLSTRPV